MEQQETRGPLLMLDDGVHRTKSRVWDSASLQVPFLYHSNPSTQRLVD